MTTCRPDCGQCCEVIPLPVTQTEAAQLNLSERDRRWILEELEPIGAREALAAAPWLRGTRTTHPHGGRAVIDFYYRCRNYDAERRICTVHDDQPDTCVLFPTGTPGWPHDHINLPPSCSFNADVGREPAPVPVRIERSSRA